MTTTPTTPLRRAAKADEPKPPEQAIHLNIRQALLAASVNYGTLEKDADNPYFKSKYLSLGALLAAVRPALTDQGVIISSKYVLLPQGWVVETTLYHVLTDTSLSSCFPVTDTSGSQKIGAAGTFGMRYNLLQLLGVASTDDDGNSTSNLADPNDFLGPVPSGQQRTEPRRLPDPNQQAPAVDWL